MPVPPAPKPSFQWTRSAAWLSVLSVLTMIGLCAVSGFMLWQMRLDAARRAEITSRSLIQVLQRDERI